MRNAPNPRLTALGSGLFCVAAMFLLACLDLLLTDGSQAAYGLLFLPVSALTALWVRRADLVTAPVAVPIGFAVGALPLCGADGFTGRAVALFTALATQAGWLYGGTLIAGVIATVRKIRLMRRRAAAQMQRRPNSWSTPAPAAALASAAGPGPRPAAVRGSARGGPPAARRSGGGGRPRPAGVRDGDGDGWVGTGGGRSRNGERRAGGSTGRSAGGRPDADEAASARGSTPAQGRPSGRRQRG